MFCCTAVTIKQQSVFVGVCSPDSSRHDDVIKWNHFPRYWPFVRGIHRSPVNSPHKTSDVFFDLRLKQQLSKQRRRR